MTAVVQRQGFLNLQDLRVLQILVYWLQQPIWPEKAKISRDNAFTLIVNLAPSLGVEIQDPNFLTQVALRISQLLLKKQAPSIPPNLKQLVADYEKHLAEDQTEQARQIIQARIEQLLQKANPLLEKEENRPICQDAAVQITEAVESYVPPLSPEEKFSLVEIEQVLEKASPEIKIYLPYAGIKPEFQTQVVKLIHQTITKESLSQLETIAKAPVSQRTVAAAKETVLKILYPQLDKSTLKTHQRLEAQIQTNLKKAFPQLPLTPEVAKAVSERVTNLVVTALPQVARPGTFLPAEIEQVSKTIQPAVNEALKQAGISITPKRLGEIVKNSLPVIRKLAATPRKLVSLPESLKTKRAIILPKAVVDQLAKTTDGVAFQSVYFILSPKLGRAYFKKIALTPAKLILDVGVSRATPEWQEMIQKGLFIEDIQASLAALKEAGLPETHPTVAILKEKMLSMVDQDRFAAKILRHYWQYDKLVGQKQIWEPRAKLFLPRLSPPPIWSRLSGFPWRLRQTFNKLGSKLKIFQRIEIAPGKNVIRFVLPDKITKILTFGRFPTFTALKGAVKLKIRQGITALAKTGLGKAITKGAAWIATKLGVKMAVTAAAAAAGPPGWLVAAAVEVVSFIGKKILKPILSKLKQIIKEPEKALALVAAGAVVMIVLPMPFALIGVVPITLGGLGLISAGVSSAGAIAGSFATSVATFFTALTTIPITNAAGLLIVGIMAGLSLATFLIVIITAGAFVLPTAPTEKTIFGPGAPPVISKYIDVSKTVAPKSQFENNELPVEITYTLTVRAKQEKLINVRIIDRTTVTKKASLPYVPERSWTVDEIETSWSVNYNLSLDDRFQDSLITNSVTVTADIENGPTRETATTSLGVIVGTPPQNCPSIWPMAHGRIAQGSFCTAWTHGRIEALDIGGGTVGVTPIVATHQGRVSTHPSPAGVYGRYVDVTGVCDGITFTSRYAHLTTINVHDGQPILMGTPVGTYGNSGNSRWGGSYVPHLHYEFINRALSMQPPYVPKPIPRGCCGFTACDSISW